MVSAVSSCRTRLWRGATDNNALRRRAVLLVGVSDDDLLSHGLSALSSALSRFTVLFGMGRGGTKTLWSSDGKRGAEEVKRETGFDCASHRSKSAKPGGRRCPVALLYFAPLRLLIVIGSSRTGN